MDRMSADSERTYAQVVDALRYHLRGIRAKVSADFCEASFEKELGDLSGDPVYEKFGFNIPEYVLIRFMGRASISIGRRLGEIYDTVPRSVAAARFGLRVDDVKLTLGNLKLDIGLRFSLLQAADVSAARDVLGRFGVKADESTQGIAIEIRYNFNPNDSSRLRKDEILARYAIDDGLAPIYLVFSSISPREEAIKRLGRAGWHFLVGADAIQFTEELFGLDLGGILDRSEVRQEIEAAVREIMACVCGSHTFQSVARKYIGN